MEQKAELTKPQANKLLKFIAKLARLIQKVFIGENEHPKVPKM